MSLEITEGLAALQAMILRPQIYSVCICDSPDASGVDHMWHMRTRCINCGSWIPTGIPCKPGDAGKSITRADIDRFLAGD